MLDDEINRLRSIATPAVLDAVQRHHNWMEEVYDDLVQRDKVEADSGRVKYYPNYIRRFGDSMNTLPGLPYQMRDPRRMYLKQRRGHQQIHDSNYIRVMEQYATRVYIDNAIDDFIQATAETYDLRTGTSSEIPKLSPAELQQVLDQHPKGVQPGNVYDANGVSFTVYQFTPGRVMYPARAIKDAVIQDALDAGLDELGIDIDALRQAIANSASGLPQVPQLQTIMGEDLTHRAVVMGGQHKMYIVPTEIANRLKRFRESSAPSPVAEAMRVATKAFKMMALHTNVFSWQGQNIFSNNIMAAVESTEILGRQKEALALLRGKLTGPQYDALLEMIHDARIWNSTFVGVGGGVGHAINRPGLRPYRADVTHGISNLHPFGDNPIGDFWRAYERRLQMIEAIPKVASFLENYSRVMQGLPVRAVGVTTGGLDPYSALAAGRVARELNVDYGTTAPTMRLIQSTLFPFSTWYIKITPHVARALFRNKDSIKDNFGLITVLSMFVAAYLWNHLMYWDTEKRMDWQKDTLHVNTGIKDEKGNPYYWSEQTPFDAAAQWVGLHTVPANLDRVMSGEWTVEDAAKQQLSDMFGFQTKATVPTAPGALMEKLLNPMIATWTNLNANRDNFTGQEIVSKSNPNLWGTLSRATPDNPVGQAIQRQYIAKKMISPYMQWTRAEQMQDTDSPIVNWFTENGPVAWRKLLGIRLANLESLDLQKWYDDRNWDQSLFDSKSKQLLDAYVEAYGKNITPDELNAMKERIQAQSGIPVTEADIGAMMAKPSFKIRVNQELLQKTQDPAERTRLINEIKLLKYQMAREGFDDASDTIKPFLGLPPVPVPAPAH